MKWGSVVSFMFLLLYPWSPLNRRLHGPQQVWMFGQRNNFLPLLGNEPWLLRCPASSLVTTLTMLPWLLANNIWTNISLLYIIMFPRHLHCYEGYPENKFHLWILPLQHCSHDGVHGRWVCWFCGKAQTEFADIWTAFTHRAVCL